MRHVGEYDAIFHVAFNDHIDLPLEVASSALKLGLPVIQWDCDASWRFHNWILPRKNRVSHFVTTHQSTLQWYKQNDMKVIKSQWAGSSLYIGNPNVAKRYDVSFCGQQHGIRQQVVSLMQKMGIDVRVFGHYWGDFQNSSPHTPKLQQMIDVLDSSRICLNLSNPWHIGTLPQIKGRHFEIPQVGGFQLCTGADNLEEYFMPDREIVIANSPNELIDYCKYYLNNPKERNEIAHNGHLRVMRDHQWKHRFKEIFDVVGI